MNEGQGTAWRVKSVDWVHQYGGSCSSNTHAEEASGITTRPRCPYSWQNAAQITRGDFEGEGRQGTSHRVPFCAQTRTCEGVRAHSSSHAPVPKRLEKVDERRGGQHRGVCVPIENEELRAERWCVKPHLLVEAHG